MEREGGRGRTFLTASADRVIIWWDHAGKPIRNFKGELVLLSFPFYSTECSRDHADRSV
jgi:hypothetical protein